VARNPEPPCPPRTAGALGRGCCSGGEEREELIRAVDRLPGRQRETLILSYYLDLPDDEIATLMGIGMSSVRSARHRALEALARNLKERS
jgi:DNA-directed RNA polymerase specialized sigma24 family protein